MSKKADPWRFRCPNGHTSWKRRTAAHKDYQTDYYCETCRRFDGNPHFDTLRDMKHETDLSPSESLERRGEQLRANRSQDADTEVRPDS